MARILHSVPAPPPASSPTPTLKTVTDSQSARRFAVGLVGPGGVPAGLAQQVSAAVGGNVQPVPTNLDQVNDSPSFVRLLASHAVGNVSYNFRGVWDASYSYVTGDETVYGSDYWLCLTPNSDSAPGTGNADWQVVGSYSSFLGAWSSTAAYAAGAEVTYTGNFWVAVSANTNSAPTVTSSDWVMAGPTSAAAISYTDGSTVQSLQPAAVGADVTADNQSATTASLSNHNTSDLAESDGLYYAAQHGANITQRFAGNGENFLINGGFESNTSGSVNGAQETAPGAALSDGWTLDYLTSAASVSAYWWSGAAYNSGHGLLLRANEGFSVPANSALGAYTIAAISAPVACNYGDVLTCAADVTSHSSGPSLTMNAVIGTQFNYSDGTNSFEPGPSITMDTGWTHLFWSPRAPGANVDGAGVESVQMFLAMNYGNSSSAPVVIPNNDTYAMFDNCVVTRNDVRVVESGAQLGDVRNAPPMFTANSGAGLRGLTISYGSATSTSATITTSAFDLVFGGVGEQVSIAYDALSVAVTGSGTETFYLWVNDPTWAGGAPTLNASTTPYSEMEQGGSIYLGSVEVTFTSGSSGGGSGSGGAGCPAVDQWVIRRGRFGLPRYVRAGEVHVGDLLRLSSRRWGRVSRSVREEQDCWAIGTRRGWALTCSATAPILTRQGDRLPAKLSGHALPVKRWLRTLQDEAVVSVPVGRRLVQHISIAGPEHHFWCGSSRGLMLAHHNMKPPTP